MNLYSAGKIAYRALRANKMRSILTMLGMIIGVAAVIAMVAIGAGANERITAQIASVGSNLLLVLPGSTTSGGLRSGFGGAPTLTMADARAIGKELSAVRLASPSVRTSGPVVYGNQNWSTVIQGATPEFFYIREWPLAEGRYFTPEEVEASSKVAVLGQTVATYLFGSESPVGKVVRIKRIPFTVIGLLERKGQSPQGQDQDDTIVMPLHAVQRRITGSQDVTTLRVSVKDGASVERAKQQIVLLMRERRKISENEDDNFNVLDTRQIADTMSGTTRVMTTLLGAVAAVSLLVGGIGIMNIMLVSVTERTREIGIRLAVGAREREVLLQFLVEAVALAAFGGLVGVAVATGGSIVLTRVMQVPYVFNLQINLVSFAFAAVIGVVFGYFPARRAARLDPIEALRHE